MTLAYRDGVQQAIGEVMPDIAGTVAAFGSEVVVILRLAGKQALILNVVDSVSPAVFSLEYEAPRETLVERDLQRVVRRLSGIAFDGNVTEQRIGAPSEGWIEEVDGVAATQIQTAVSDIGHLHGGGGGNFARHAEIPLAGVYVPANPIEPRDGWHGCAALRQEIHDRIRQVWKRLPHQRRVARNIVGRNRIRPEANRVSLPEEAATRTDDSPRSDQPGDTETRAPVVLIRPEIRITRRAEGAEALIVRLGCVVLVVEHGFIVPAQAVIDGQVGPEFVGILHIHSDLVGARNVSGIADSETGAGGGVVDEILNRRICHARRVLAETGDPNVVEGGSEFDGMRALDDGRVAAELVAGRILDAASAVAGDCGDSGNGYERIRLVGDDLAAPALSAHQKNLDDIGISQEVVVNGAGAGPGGAVRR